MPRSSSLSVFVTFVFLSYIFYFFFISVSSSKVTFIILFCSFHVFLL